MASDSVKIESFTQSVLCQEMIAIHGPMTPDDRGVLVTMFYRVSYLETVVRVFFLNTEYKYVLACDREKSDFGTVR